MIGASSRVWWLRPFHLLLRATLVACSHMPTPGLSVLSGRPAAAMGHGSWRSLSVSSSGLLLVNTRLTSPPVASPSPIVSPSPAARALSHPVIGLPAQRPQEQCPPSQRVSPLGPRMPPSYLLSTPRGQALQTLETADWVAFLGNLGEGTFAGLLTRSTWRPVHRVSLRLWSHQRPYHTSCHISPCWCVKSGER